MEGLTTTGSAEFVTPRRGTAVLQNGVDLARHAEEVFDYLSDLRNEKEWNPKMQLVEAVTDGPPRAGSKFRAKWQGSPVTIVEYITYERPKAWSATAPSKSLTIDFYGTVTPTETGSRLDVRMTVIPHGPLRLLLAAPTSANAATRVGQHALHQGEVGRPQLNTAMRPSTLVGAPIRP